MKKTLLLSLIFFISGFLTHALFFPEVLSNGITDVQNVALPAPTTAQNESNDPLVTQITFDGKKFSKHNITILYTNYVQITNMNEKKPMDLIGTTKELTTPRPYGFTEALKTQFNEKGQYAVADKTNPSERLIITVK